MLLVQVTNTSWMLCGPQILGSDDSDEGLTLASCPDRGASFFLLNVRAVYGQPLAIIICFEPFGCISHHDFMTQSCFSFVYFLSILYLIIYFQHFFCMSRMGTSSTTIWETSLNRYVEGSLEFVGMLDQQLCLCWRRTPRWGNTKGTFWRFSRVDGCSIEVPEIYCGQTHWDLSVSN